MNEGTDKISFHNSMATEKQKGFCDGYGADVCAEITCKCIKILSLNTENF